MRNLLKVFFQQPHRRLCILFRGVAEQPTVGFPHPVSQSDGHAAGIHAYVEALMRVAAGAEKLLLFRDSH